MPQMADITVKKADGTTNIVYSQLVPSSGDGQPAIWRSETAGASAGHKPVLEVVSRSNGNRTARRVEASFTYPQTATDSTTSLTTVVNRIPFTLSAAIPLAVPDSVRDEAIEQAVNLFQSLLVRSCFKAGYAAT